MILSSIPAKAVLSIAFDVCDGVCLEDLSGRDHEGVLQLTGCTSSPAIPTSVPRLLRPSRLFVDDNNIDMPSTLVDHVFDELGDKSNFQLNRS